MKRRNIIKHIFLLFKGVIVGFGAIMPGISGGTLCVSFGMYKPLLNVMSHPKNAIKEDGVKLLLFIVGAGVGFIGLAGLAGWLLALNSAVVTFVFIGFVLGTMPELWSTAGEKGRNLFSYIFLSVGFVLLLCVLILLRFSVGISISPGIGSFFFCGIMWGMSFVVPGLSSSTLIMFFGLYQPMLEGISSFSLSVILPLAAGVVSCLFFGSRAINAIYQKWYSQISHAIIGIVAASMVMVIPFDTLDSACGILTGVLCILAGAVASFFIGKLCAKLTQS